MADFRDKIRYVKVDIPRLLYLLGDDIFLKYVNNCYDEFVIYERQMLDNKYKDIQFGFRYGKYIDGDNIVWEHDLDINTASIMYISKVIERY